MFVFETIIKAINLLLNSCHPTGIPGHDMWQQKQHLIFSERILLMFLNIK